MENRTRFGLLTALLGVLTGFLLFAVADKVGQRRGMKAEYANWQKLNVILNEVRKNYVDTVDVEKLTDAAVVAALAKLDPHTIYLPPEELQTSETELAGNFDGIGIQFNVPNDTAIVLEVIPGGPAEKAGMLQGDRLMYIDDVPVAGVKFPQDSMVRRM
ncbi:MAG: PDZ domain-containing protein, partial [Bacteroidales bacterium]|nr:PDZ domain-containing protein [Bacteroidales bacterium]